MKPKLSEENIKANLSKRHKSSTDIEKFIPKKTSSNKKSYLEIKDKENKENNNQNNFFICNHKSNFISFCEICSLDLCSNCEEKHINHKIIKFADIIPKKEEIDKINITIKKYLDDYNKLIEEIYKWKKELDKKIFYFEEQIKNNPTINKNIEYIKNFDFSNNNNYSSITKYIHISDMILKSVNNDNNENIVGCYSFINYINSKEVLDRILDYENDDFILKSNDIIKLIFSFLSKKIFKYENKFKEETKNISPINNCKINDNYKFFTTNTDNIYNNTYTFSNSGKKEGNMNEININYFNSTITNNVINKNLNRKEEQIKNKPVQKEQKIENQLKLINNIFLEEKKEIPNNNEESNNNMNYIKFKKNIIKSTSGLKKINDPNSRNGNDFQCKEIIFNPKTNNETNYNINNNLNTKITKNALSNIYSINNKNDAIYKYVPKIKKQNRVYTINSPNINNNLNTINSYNNINENNSKKNIYRHKKLKSISISSYINQSLPNTFNNDYENLATLNNSTGNYTNLIKPINIETIKNTYNKSLERNNYNFFNTNMTQIYSLNTLDINKTPSTFYSNKVTKPLMLNNKRNEIKKKLLTKNSFSHSNYKAIIETPITFSSKLSSENNTLKNTNEYITNNINDFILENDKYLIDSSKNLFVGLELGNGESGIGILNQSNYNNIELFNLDIDYKGNKKSIPTIISFDSKSNEIKIGNEAQNNILNNPSQTIFNILKIIGKSYKQINNNIDLWPFKLYYNEDLCRPYVKIN